MVAVKSHSTLTRRLLNVAPQLLLVVILAIEGTVAIVAVCLARRRERLDATRDAAEMLKPCSLVRPTPAIPGIGPKETITAIIFRDGDAMPGAVM